MLKSQITPKTPVKSSEKRAIEQESSYISLGFEDEKYSPTKFIQCVGENGSNKKMKRNSEVRKSQPYGDSALLKSKPIWQRSPTAYHNKPPALWLHEEITEFVDYISPTRVEHEVRLELVNRLQQFAFSELYGAKCTIYGSFASMLYLPDSDMDCMISGCHNVYSIGKALRSCSWATKVQVIGKAKVPIVKFVDRYTNLMVDISLERHDSVKSVRVTNSLLAAHPAARPLLLVTKVYLGKLGLTDVSLGGIGSYSLLIMLINFLNLHPLIQAKQINPTNNLGVLLIEFFELYGYVFNYRGVTISINRYFPRDDTRFTQPALRGNPTPAIIDPVDETRNVARSTTRLEEIREAFRNAYTILTSHIFIAAYKKRRNSIEFQSSQDYSLLCGLLNIENDLMNIRKRLAKVHKQLYHPEDND